MDRLPEALKEFENAALASLRRDSVDPIAHATVNAIVSGLKAAVAAMEGSRTRSPVNSYSNCSVQDFWLSVLKSGVMPSNHGNDDWKERSIAVSRESLYQSYCGWHTKHSDDVLVSRELFGRTLKGLLDGDLGLTAPRQNGKQQRCYILPALPNCRNILQSLGFDVVLDATTDFDDI